jgi:hypothetical protein
LDFWIVIVIGLVGIGVSYLAYLEAGSAKKAAVKAGRSVKIQTITIELSEIAQRLDKLEMGISYSAARDLLNEIARRLHRLISPFQDEKDFKQVIVTLKDSLEAAKKALAEVRPETNEDESHVDDNDVYYGIEGHLSTISSVVADLMGICEKHSLSEK